MRKLMFLLVPLALFAQVVEIDTVLPLNTQLWNGCYISDLNKLYIQGDYKIFAVDCSTYQVESIPVRWESGVDFYAYNWRRRKLYVVNDMYWDTLLVIDVIADTILKRLPSSSSWGVCYVSTFDRVYFGSTVLKALDCATDTVIMEKEPSISGYLFDAPFWDSVGMKLYVGMGGWGLPDMMAVYEPKDSLIALFRTQIHHPVVMEFHYELGKGYFVGYDNSSLGVIDIKNNTFLKAFPFTIPAGEFKPFAVDTIDNKVYCGRGGSNYPDTIYVIDCLTDSIVNKLAESGHWGPPAVRWAPWSNRLYFTGGPQQETLKVLDCRTDSVIARVRLEEHFFAIPDLQLDAVHQRIFAIGDSTLYVLREVIPGVDERDTLSASRPPPTATVVRDVLFLSAVGAEHPVSSVLIDVTGRKVLDLRLGANDVRHLAPGVYFLRSLTMSDPRVSRMALIK